MENATPLNDAWDWPLLMYVATVILRRTERQFWRMTPRKLRSLTDVYTELKNQSSEEDKHGYINEVM